ncbi:AfsR/SARP family transcriptional regulator [Tenggerimyces flavus]|uniref:BTAD domain-containing putative transcriptional regulator n=1 Tax=Tenggerimyces flavus TaxID=1708749 RepID=A0ABV7YLP1_9ACTN|nr:BTAD domain-containing putative transcriptional regulator [Tenggerimyces flavus]MBM7784750.1 DNA-binding SARP family transcriptional activator [Tenggerimyces flavus]
MTRGARVEVGLLGPLEVRVGGAVVELRSRRLWSVLSVLALSAGRPLLVETLYERVWGDDPPEDVRGALYTCVRRLRTVLGDDRITNEGGRYTLQVSPDAVDASRFADLLDLAPKAGPEGSTTLVEEALALWRGRPFTEPLSDWLCGVEARRLTELYLSAVQDRVDAELTAGRGAGSVPELQDLVAEHPLREPLWTRLLLALDRAGRPADALAAYEQVRSRLAEELGIDPGRELQAIYAGLLVGAKLTGPVTAPADRPQVPRQLPADTVDFVGRVRELRRLDSLVEAGQALIAVHGAGGTGKTALAVRWGHRARERFPDGQLFVDLRGYGPGEPMEPAMALDTMLRGLGVPGERIPAGVDGQAALLRTTLADRRVLVVLDNARDAGQVRPMLPGAGAVVLITSRSQLRGLTARERASGIPLEALPANEAEALLAQGLDAQAVPYDRDSVAELAARCGNLPLGLVIAAERAGRYPDLPVGELVSQLRGEQERLDVLETGQDPTTSLRAVISWSYHALARDGARLFRLLGLFPGASIGIPATSALAGSERAVAAKLLDRLAEVHLLASPRPGRYAMHDLVRAYAAEQAADHDDIAERESAVGRLYEWYARTSENARSAAGLSQLPPGDEPSGEVEPATFDNERHAMSWLAAELETLIAMTADAARFGQHRHIFDLVRGVSSYVRLHRLPIDVIPLLELALASARTIGDDLSEARMLMLLGSTHDVREEFEQALRYYISAGQLYETLGDHFGASAALGNIGLLYSTLGSLDKAANSIEDAIENARRHGVGDRVATELNNLAGVYTELGRYADAEAAAAESISLWGSEGKALDQTYALDTMGSVHLASGDHVQATSYFERVVEVRRRLCGGWLLAYGLRSLGNAQRAAGDPHAARASWEEALHLVETTGATDTEELSRSDLREKLADLASDA